MTFNYQVTTHADFVISCLCWYILYVPYDVGTAIPQHATMFYSDEPAVAGKELVVHLLEQNMCHIVF